jgi:hypothetical protein
MVVAAATPSTAQDTIVIKRGMFVFPVGGQGTFDLSGTHGFRLNATVSLVDGNFAAIDKCRNPECFPGTVLDLSAGWGGSAFVGTARIGGVTYGLSGMDPEAGVAVQFSGSVTLPPLSAGPVTVSAPFSLSGVFAYGFNGPEPKEALLTGGGVVTLTLVVSPEDPQAWTIQEVVFEFRPGRQG